MMMRETVDAVLAELDMTQATAAEAIGMSPQQLNGKLVRNTLRADEFLKLMDAIGIDIKYSVRGNGKDVRTHAKGYGRHIKCMVDRVIYDTDASEVLANNFWADGENEYNDGIALELYVDSEGRYFFAVYSSWESVKDCIRTVSGKDAAAFVEKYGTEIFREHS